MQCRRHNAKVTSKGQITIPRDVRRLLRLQPGDSVVFEVDGDGVHLRAPRPTSIFAQHAGILREGEGLTVEEINRQIREMRGHDPDEFESPSS